MSNKPYPFMTPCGCILVSYTSAAEVVDVTEKCTA